MHLKNGKAVKSVFTLSTLTASCLLAFNSYAAVDCAPLEVWDSSKVYNGGDQVQHEGNAYKARYWTQNNNPAQAGQWGEWESLGACDGTGPVDPPQNEIPTVTLTAPSASASITAGEVVNLAADAADTDGTISKVEFFVDGALVGQSTSAPFTASWTATEGVHEFSTKSYDDAGAVSTASSVTLTIASAQPGNEAPTVDVALSATSIELGGTVTLTANAADADGSVAKVDFYVAGALAGTATAAPYTLDVTPSKAGALAVYAKATDNAGASTDSAIATLTVNGGAVASNCRPDGLYQTTGVDVPYCSIYDEEGREKMGADHPRRVIG
ncbi:Ig-like domain-containing protein [Vibrio parahaemolyticus]|nr:Ig-like domain-containing protein [Vibrio parahaemolyticus]